MNKACIFPAHDFHFFQDFGVVIYKKIGDFIGNILTSKINTFP